MKYICIFLIGCSSRDARITKIENEIVEAKLQQKEIEEVYEKTISEEHVAGRYYKH